MTMLAKYRQRLLVHVLPWYNKVCCARRGGSGALLPAIRYSGVELLSAVSYMQGLTSTRSVDVRVLRNRSL